MNLQMDGNLESYVTPFKELMYTPTSLHPKVCQLTVKEMQIKHKKLILLTTGAEKLYRNRSNVYLHYGNDTKPEFVCGRTLLPYMVRPVYKTHGNNLWKKYKYMYS